MKKQGISEMLEQYVGRHFNNINYL